MARIAFNKSWFLFTMCRIIDNVANVKIQD